MIAITAQQSCSESESSQADSEASKMHPCRKAADWRDARIARLGAGLQN
jgi:hypothetical protein